MFSQGIYKHVGYFNKENNNIMGTLVTPDKTGM